MNFTMEYYLLKYERVIGIIGYKKMQNIFNEKQRHRRNCGKKKMGKESFSVYSLLKSIKNKNLIKVLECFRDEDKTIEIEEYVNGKKDWMIIFGKKGNFRTGC